MMEKKENKTLAQQAMDSALFFLKFRNHSVADMQERLKRKKFSENLVCQTINRLCEMGLLNDEKLARELTEKCYGAGYGKIKIQNTLCQKGIPRQMIDRVLLTFYSDGHDEFHHARETLEKRVKKFEGLDKKTLYMRLGRYLTRQGFSEDVVEEILEKYRVPFDF